MQIKAIDQFGKPARKYSIKAKLLWISRYHWLFPLWASHESTINLKTDDCGEVKLTFPLRKEFSIEFEQVDNESYIFSQKKDSQFGNVKWQPKLPLDLKEIGEKNKILN